MFVVSFRIDLSPFVVGRSRLFLGRTHWRGVELNDRATSENHISD